MVTDASRLSRLFLVGALAAVLFAAGCGESDEDKAADYRKGLDEAYQSFSTELREAGAIMRAAGRAKSPAQYEQGADQLQAATDDFKSELDELSVPQDAEDEEETVKETVDDFAETVARINEAVQARDTSAVQAQQEEVRVLGAAVDKAITDLKTAVD